MNRYKLLTPGPLTVSDSVRQVMDFDYSTWDEDYKNITQEIRKDLLAVADVSSDEYTTVLLQGSGTYGVEAVLTTLTNAQSKMLIVSNGKYGERIQQQAEYAQLNYAIYETAYNEIPQPSEIDQFLNEDDAITHVMMVHSETTSGIINPIEEVGAVVKKHGKIFIADTMSSFGGIPIDMQNIDAIVTSSNKCIQGVPGFTIAIIKKAILEQCEGNATTLSLDLYDQYQAMASDGKWRFTSPTHAVVAFKQALKEFVDEGGVEARYQRYSNNQRILSEGLEKLGFAQYVPASYQGPIITTFIYPADKPYTFEDMYNFFKDRGYVIYPGKLTDADTFRIGSIGEIYPEDMDNVIAIMADFLKEYNNND